MLIRLTTQLYGFYLYCLICIIFQNRWYKEKVPLCCMYYLRISGLLKHVFSNSQCVLSGGGISSEFERMRSTALGAELRHSDCFDLAEKLKPTNNVNRAIQFYVLF